MPFATTHTKTPLLCTGGIGIDRAAEMKLGLVPPLVLLCSDLLLHSSPPLISALPFDPLASGAAPTGRPPTLSPVHVPSLISAMWCMSCLRFSFSSFSFSLDLVVYGASRWAKIESVSFSLCFFFSLDALILIRRRSRVSHFPAVLYGYR